MQYTSTVASLRLKDVTDCAFSLHRQSLLQRVVYIGLVIGN